MKRMIIAALSFFFLLTTAIPALSEDYGRGTHGRQDYKERPDRPSQHDYKKGPDYHRYRGYKERPYGKHRHYRYHNYKGHRYNYRGHWRSWDEWDRHAKKHRHLYKNGRYYRENKHLMFRFRDPDTGNYFFFSIGR